LIPEIFKILHGDRLMRTLNNLSRLAFSASAIAIVATLGTPAFAQTQTTTQPNPSDQTPPPTTNPPGDTTQSSA